MCGPRAVVRPIGPVVTDNVKRIRETEVELVGWPGGELDFRLSYALTLSSNDQPIRADNGTQPAQGSGATTPTGTGGNFPDVRGQWSRLEAWPSTPSTRTPFRLLGVNGQAYAKLRYVWERNSVNNYDQDIMQAYMNPLINNTGFMTWMAYNNPNYNVHLIGASLGVKW